MVQKIRGVVYIATGKKYVDEALVSAASLKRHMPNLPVTLFTNELVDSDLFDNIIKIDNPKFGSEDKVRYINESSYDYTLFLDTDTYICDDISELFDLLNRFDMAIAHVTMKRESNIKGIPKSFVVLDTGIILFKKSSKVRDLFSNWLKLYLRDKKRGHMNLPNIILIKEWIESLKKRKRRRIRDAPSFNEVIYNSEIRFATLTKEYYFRGKCGFVNWKVKIIHCRRRDFNLIDKTINSKFLPRIYIWSDRKLNVFGLSKNNPEESKRIKAYINGKDPRNHFKDLVNYPNKIIGVSGIFLKKYFPKVYYLLKR